MSCRAITIANATNERAGTFGANFPKFESVMLMNIAIDYMRGIRSSSQHSTLMKADAVLLIAGIHDDNNPQIKTLLSCVKSRNLTIFDEYREILLITLVWQLTKLRLPTIISFEQSPAATAYVKSSNQYLKSLIAAK